MLEFSPWRYFEQKSQFGSGMANYPEAKSALFEKYLSFER